MDQWTDLRGMAPEAAKEYILAHITDLKLLEQKVAEAEVEAKTWEDRAKLAQEKGLVELLGPAQARAAETRAKADALKAEALALKADIERMREQVPGLQARVRSVDPDVLLANLQMVTGEMEHPGAAKVEEGVKAVQADDALAALKASLGMAPPKPEPAQEEPAADDGSPGTDSQAPGQTAG
jgi:hypothetical protein